MADKEVWNLGGPIGAPAAADRVPIATAPGAGGYSLRGSFCWKNAAGTFQFDNNSFIPITKSHYFYTTEYGIGTPNSAGMQIFWQPADRLRLGTMTGTTFADLATLNGTGFGIGLGTAAVPVAKLHVKSNAEIARFETSTVRGSGNGYIGLADPTGRKGFFGYGGGNDDLHFMNEILAAVRFGTGSTFRWQIEAAGHFAPVGDNTYNLARAALRIANSYFAVSPTVTSDEREKKWRGGLTKAELLAGERVLEELGFYQWLDAIDAKKGKAQARFHFGARAQRVWGIFAECGLVDPIGKKGPGKTPYAFLCYDAWEEQRTPEMVDVEIPATLDADGNEDAPARVERQPTGKQLFTVKAGNRYGLRTDQFALFLVAVIHELRKRDAARIDALEQAIADLKKALPAA